MLPKNIRPNLRQNTDFFKEAESLSSRHLRLLFRRNPDEQKLKLAFIVSKRHGGAVQRVKTKRQLRHASMAIKQELPALFALPYSSAILVKGRPQDYQLYKQEIEQLLSKLQNYYLKNTV